MFNRSSAGQKRALNCFRIKSTRREREDCRNSTLYIEAYGVTIMVSKG